MKQISDLEREADREVAMGNLQGAQQSLERAIMSDGATLDRWSKLSAIRRALGDIEGALAAIEKALTLSPLDFSALLARAMLLERRGSPAAGEAFGNALAQLPPETALPKAMVAAVEHARSRAAEHQSSVERRLIKSIPEGLRATQRGRLERLASNTSRRTRHFHQEPTNFHFPGLPEVEFHPRELFPWLEEVEAATDAIRLEYEALVSSELGELVPYTQYPDHVPLAQWKELNNNRDWTAIHLLQSGQPVEKNAKHCPVTLELLSKLPQPHIPGACPNAMFSLLAPKTHIPPHTGVANVRLLTHLPVVVPPGCRFRVGETTREWNVGEAFVFDDTIEHEAWNDSDQLRVVLIFDVWAPGIDVAERHAVAKMIAAAGVSFSGA